MSHTVILHKRTEVTGRTPEVSALTAGELAVNAADGKIFTKTVDDTVRTFINTEQLPYTLDLSLSSVTFQFGNNSVTGILSKVLGGIDNNVTGSGSSVLNGSDNDIDGDYSFIGSGSNNKIFNNGDLGAILGGQNNALYHQESFIIGSNITSHLSGVTYVNNISATGKLYGDGSNLTGIVAEGVSGPDIELRSLSANWQETYTLVQAESSNWGGAQPTLKKHDLVEIDTYSISYCGTAPFGTFENEQPWNITKILLTETGSISSIQTATNTTWTGRLTSNYL